jgi:aspartate/methionine/tyrosine aminotransferase
MKGPFVSEYLQWFKTRKPARFNLAASGVLPCSLEDLGERFEDAAISRPGAYGFGPLQRAIAEHCRVREECVVAASGTSMANFLVMAALIEPGDEVLIESPTYDPLLSLAHYFGAMIKRFPRGGSIRGVISNRTRLVVVTNLHNPSCERMADTELQDLAGAARSVGARVLVDEVYLECLYGNAATAFHLGEGFITTRSLTKAYGLDGLRCGWVIAPPDLVRRMWGIKDLIDPGAPYPAEQLSVAAFRNLDRLAVRAKTLLEKNRALLADFLRSCDGLELAIPEYGTCVFPRVKRGNADELLKLLHDRYDVDVVPGRFFERPDHFRIGIGGDNAAFEEALQRLGQALNSGSGATGAEPGPA